MGDILIAFAFGFAVASLLFGVAWYNAWRRARRLEMLLRSLGVSWCAAAQVNYAWRCMYE